MIIIERLLKIIFCHLIGDYVLQTRFIAESKGDNWYHLLVHCFLYVLPFYLAFGLDYRLIIVLVFHIIIDPLKARYNMLDYFGDQVCHYITALIYLL